MDTWISKYKYQINGAVGHVIYHPRTNVYTLTDKRKTIWPVSLEEGQAIQKAENSKPENGRPALFPGKAVESRTVTMPVEYWKKMKEPYSIAIAAAIHYTYFRPKE